MTYSVVLLWESKIETPPVYDEKVFEESIVLCTLPEGFFADTDYPGILKYFTEKFPPHRYQNADGAMVSHEIIAVIDSFPVLDPICFEEFAEVYSRHLIESPKTTLADMIQKYYFDFSYIEQKGCDPYVSQHSV